MSINPIQFQRGLSLPDFLSQYGTEAQCESALEKVRWRDGFRCPQSLPAMESEAKAGRPQ